MKPDAKVRFHINGSSYTLMFATFWLEMEAQ